MTGRIEHFARDIRVATAGLEPDAINAELARFARAELAGAIGRGEASETYERYVNGREGVSEDAVQAPGPILYRFAWWDEILTSAISELARRSPRRTGRFVSSFVAIAGGRLVTDMADLDGAAEVIVTNAQPYVRRIDSGAQGLHARLFAGAVAALKRQYGASGAFRFEVRYLNIPPGIHRLIPYRLRRSHGRRRDRRAGMPITYPAIVMNRVD